MTKSFLLLLLSIVCLTGCKTNDFRIVEEIQKGMSKETVHSKCSAYGFESRERLIRPDEGWSAIKTFMDLPEQAAAIEKQLNITVKSAEYYPVTHGVFGYGQLFVFYDEKDQVVDFYRVQIN